LVLLLAPATWGLTLWGVDIKGLEVQSSYWMVRNAVADGAPDPLVNTLGASIPFRFSGSWVFRPEVQVFALGYKYEGGRAVPESPEWPNVSILTIAIHPTLGWETILSPTLSWTGEGGLAFLARSPIFFNGAGSADMALPVTGWLLAGRLVYPSAGASLVWQFSPLFAAVVRGQVLLPVFNLWTGERWDDQLTGGLGLGLRLTF